MRKFVWMSVLLVAVLATTAMQAEKFSSKSCKMSVSGTSTLHDWSCPASRVSSNADITVNAGEIQAVNSLWLEVDVKSIKSEKEAMDEKIYEALKADAHQKITFQLLKTKSIEKKGNDFSIVANGTMTVAGNAQNVDLTVTGKILANGDLEFSGVKKMKMTTFKVDPPSAMWGVVKSGDDISVNFTLVMKKG